MIYFVQSVCEGSMTDDGLAETLSPGSLAGIPVYNHIYSKRDF